MGFGLFVFLLILIVAGIIYVYFNVMDNPEERFRKKSLMGLDKNYGVTFPGFYYYLKITDKKGNIKNDLIINPDTLIEGEDNHIGRIIGNPQSKNLKEKLSYKLNNKELFFGIRTGVASSLGHKHLQLFKDCSSGEAELAVCCDHQNGMFFVDSEEKHVRSEQVVITDYDVAVIEAGGYFFIFEKVDIGSDGADKFLEDYINRHSRKEGSNNTQRKKRNNPYATRPDDEEAAQEPATRPADGNNALSGGGRKIRR